MPLSFDDFDPVTAIESSVDAFCISIAKSRSKSNLTILDIGCGSGGLLNQFAELGHVAIGIEPQAAQKMRETPVGAQIHQGVGEALPFDDAHFDVVMFGHSLHHVPQKVLHLALAEAVRVLKPSGDLIVAEPLAEGPFYHVMQPVDDEAPLYEIVKQALTSSVDDGHMKHKSRTYVFSKPTYKTVEHLKRILVRVDPDRAKAPTSAWLEFNKRFLAQPKTWFFGKRPLKHFSRIDLFEKTA